MTTLFFVKKVTTSSIPMDNGNPMKIGCRLKGWPNTCHMTASNNTTIITTNSARGQLVDEAAIVNGIESGKIQYYAADVLTEENPDLNKHPFMDYENIILTPHIAFYSEESVREASIESAMNVKNFFHGNYKEAQIVNGVYG